MSQLRKEKTVKAHNLQCSTFQSQSSKEVVHNIFEHVKFDAKFCINFHVLKNIINRSFRALALQSKGKRVGQYFLSVLVDNQF